jgi:hypothetical protein
MTENACLMRMFNSSTKIEIYEQVFPWQKELYSVFPFSGLKLWPKSEKY